MHMATFQIETYQVQRIPLCKVHNRFITVTAARGIGTFLGYCAVPYRDSLTTADRLTGTIAITSACVIFTHHLGLAARPWDRQGLSCTLSICTEKLLRDYYLHDGFTYRAHHHHGKIRHGTIRLKIECHVETKRTLKTKEKSLLEHFTPREYLLQFSPDMKKLARSKERRQHYPG